MSKPVDHAVAVGVAEESKEGHRAEAAGRARSRRVELLPEVIDT